MKKILLAICAAVMLCGCSGSNELLDRAMNIRAELIASQIRFDAQVTADYGDKSYTFGMACTAQTDGTLDFEVTEPETIAGITGSISATGGKLSFDDVALAFELMADEQLSPVSAPWILVKTLRSGYLTSCNEEEGLLRLAIDDSYEEDALHLDIWLDGQDLPKYAEVYWQGRRLLTVTVSNFTYV